MLSSPNHYHSLCCSSVLDHLYQYYITVIPPFAIMRLCSTFTVFHMTVDLFIIQYSDFILWKTNCTMDKITRNHYNSPKLHMRRCNWAEHVNKLWLLTYKSRDIIFLLGTWRPFKVSTISALCIFWNTNIFQNPGFRWWFLVTSYIVTSLSSVNMYWPTHICVCYLHGHYHCMSFALLFGYRKTKVGVHYGVEQFDFRSVLKKTGARAK